MTTATPMPWIKVRPGLLNDPKFALLPDVLKWRLMELNLIAGECDAEGYLVNGDEALTVDDLAWRLRREPEQLRADLELLANKGFVAIEDEVWLVVGFSEEQGRPQSEKRELWRDRQRRRRERQQPDTGDDMGPEVPEEPGESEEDVTRDSRVSHAGVTALEKRRVEESRGESAANAANGPPPRPPPKKTESQTKSKTPAAVLVFRQNAHRYPAKAWYNDVAEVVGEEEADLEFWGHLVKHWVGKGYNPTNVADMLECFKNGELPGGTRRPEVDRDGQGNKVLRVGQ